MLSDASRYLVQWPLYDGMYACVYKLHMQPAIHSCAPTPRQRAARGPMAPRRKHSLYEIARSMHMGDVHDAVTVLPCGKQLVTLSWAALQTISVAVIVSWLLTKSWRGLSADSQQT
jgi:hypothetical protein